MFNRTWASGKIKRINIDFICFKFTVVKENKKTLNCKIRKVY